MGKLLILKGIVLVPHSGIMKEVLGVVVQGHLGGIMEGVLGVVVQGFLVEGPQHGLIGESHRLIREPNVLRLLPMKIKRANPLHFCFCLCLCFFFFFFCFFVFLFFCFLVVMGGCLKNCADHTAASHQRPKILEAHFYFYFFCC